MNYRKIRVGMKVRILKIDVTHRLHNSNVDMQHMVGKKFKVRYVEDSYKGIAEHPYMITLKPDENQYHWDPEDLERVGLPVKMPKVETFDPKNLVL